MLGGGICCGVAEGSAGHCGEVLSSVVGDRGVGGRGKECSLELRWLKVYLRIGVEGVPALCAG
eukprot:12333829-Ditylum_brightwellii.AAC.1